MLQEENATEDMQQDNQNATPQLPVSYAIKREDLRVGKVLFRKPKNTTIIYRGSYRYRPDRPVAIKYLPMGNLLPAEALKAFKHEVQIHSSLRSLYIVPFYGCCMKPPCIVMDYMPGGSLNDILRENPDVLSGWDIKTRISYEICKGVAALHEAGIIHRDIKSPNVLFTKDFHPKISDFGISSTIEESPSAIEESPSAIAESPYAIDESSSEIEDSSSEESSSATFTLLEECLGTPAWMAPELFVSDPPPRCTLATDIFSLGLTLQELVTRKLPCEDLMVEALNDTDWYEAVAERRLRGIPESPLPDDCPWKLKELIEACLNIDPKQRPAASEMVYFLEEPNPQRLQHFLPAYRLKRAAEKASACWEAPASLKRLSA